ncbi:hypothetical protein [Novosphingobium arvoryzae]|uniref:hypothetical protein n=1 Tax=Novosphingobium arvoryzae TaxID=1256514 RepID=UPI0035B34903
MDKSGAGKRFWAVYLKRTSFTLFFVFFAALIWERAFLEPYERNGVEAGFWAIALYIAASVVFGIMNALSGLAYLWIFGGNDLKDLVLSDLRNSRLPGPQPYQAKRFDYLAELADDEDVDPKIRVKAAALHSSYQVSIQQAGIFGGLALAKALDEATLRYSAEAPA